MSEKYRYRVVANVTISVSTIVEAGSYAEAIELAKEHEMQSFCAQCSGADEEDVWTTAGELDGEPQDLRAKRC